MPNLRKLLPLGSNGAAAAPDRLPLAVLEFQSPTAAIIATPLPPMAAATNYILTAFILSILLICGFVKTDRLVTSRGELVSEAPDSSIQVFDTASILHSISVHTGELVSRGQVLATLDPTYATADLTSLTQQEQEYTAQVAQLQAQETGAPYIPDPTNPASALALETYNQEVGEFNSTEQEYDEKISELQTEIQGYHAQAAYYQQRLGIASNVEAMRKSLQQLQVGSRLDTLAATDDRVNVQSELASAISSAAADARELASDEAERDSLKAQIRAQSSTQLATALTSLYQTRQELAKAKLADQLIVLTAPQDSIVQTVSPVSVGSVLQPGQTIVELTPTHAPLTVQTELSAVESGFVHVGNKVLIKFDTLPYVQFGSANGIVTSISPESFNPLDQQATVTSGAPMPGGPQTLYYKAEVSLDEINLHNVPPGFQLVPGMPLEADMVVGKRTILGYFLSRMMPVAYDSMHEP